MAFSSRQRRSLAAKLKYQHVKTRSNQGATLSYLEGWHVIAEANRIFGYDCWDRKTLSPRCVWSERQAGQVAAFYTTKVRITVRAGGETTLRPPRSPGRRNKTSRSRGRRGAKRDVHGQNVYDAAGQLVGRIDDLILVRRWWATNWSSDAQ